MRRVLILLVVAAVVVMMVPVAPLGATPPGDVQIVVDNGAGPFVASGAAVDDGLLCASGEAEDLFAKASGFKSSKGVNLKVLKKFVCDDDSGTFTLKLQVRIAKGVATFNWTVVDGTGAFEDLHGSGKGESLAACPVEDPDCGAFTDSYFGKVHID